MNLTNCAPSFINILKTLLLYRFIGCIFQYEITIGIEMWFQAFDYHVKYRSASIILIHIRFYNWNRNWLSWTVKDKRVIQYSCLEEAVHVWISSDQQVQVYCYLVCRENLDTILYIRVQWKTMRCRYHITSYHISVCYCI